MATHHQHTKKIKASNPKFIPFNPIYHPVIKMAMGTGPHLELFVDDVPIEIWEFGCPQRQNRLTLPLSW
jgi:hypothetical protein